MKRHWLVALAALATVPAIASAQMRGVDEGWGPKLRATPFLGWSPGFESAGNLAVSTGGTNPIQGAEYSFDYAPGPITGVNLEARAHGRFSAVGMLAWSSRGRTTSRDDDGFLFEEPGSDFWIARVGGLMRFREDSDLQLRRLNAAVFAGPAFLREVPETSIFSSSAFDSARNHWGVSFGAEGELPFANKMFALHAAFEDIVIFWDETSLQQRMDGSIRASFGDLAAAEVDADHSHMFVLRVGLSVRFR
ncbi:MAG: hypothetical protein WEE89_11100 [Gemmatimonadota bacterium]